MHIFVHMHMYALTHTRMHVFKKIGTFAYISMYIYFRIFLFLVKRLLRTCAAFALEAAYAYKSLCVHKSSFISLCCWLGRHSHDHEDECYPIRPKMRWPSWFTLFNSSDLRTVMLIEMPRFYVGKLLLHHYKSDLAHTSD